MRSFAWIVAASVAACSPASLPVAQPVSASRAAQAPESVARVPSEKPIHYFTGAPDGELPSVGRLTLDGSGTLFGSTNAGGSGKCSFRGTRTGCGTIFELSRSPAGDWSERVVYSFKNLEDGAGPFGTLTLGASGHIFGVTMAGGNRGCVPLFWVFRGCGTAFELIPSGKDGWTKRTLHVFSGGGDGGNPVSGLVLDARGTLYGTAHCGGGLASCYNEGGGAGVFYQLARNPGEGWSETVLHVFGSSRGDDAYPFGDLTPNGTTTIYGTTAATVYSMSRSSPTSPWGDRTLYVFPGNFADGYYPQGGLALDAAGNLYGTTHSGGNFSCSNGCGVVFELSPARNGFWKETVLHVFSGGADGALSDAGLAIDSQGRLFGTTTNGGELTCNGGGGCGVVFSLRPRGKGSPETVLHTFEDDAADGGMPMSAVILNRAGDLFGATEYGGRGRDLGKGTAYKITLRASP